MVMLTKVGSKLAMLFACLLTVLAALHRSVHDALNGAWHNELAIEPIPTPHPADKQERLEGVAVQEKQPTQIAPPPPVLIQRHIFNQPRSPEFPFAAIFHSTPRMSAAVLDANARRRLPVPYAQPVHYFLSRDSEFGS
jgi:hypothetical protein